MKKEWGEFTGKADLWSLCLGVFEDKGFYQLIFIHVNTLLYGRGVDKDRITCRQFGLFLFAGQKHSLLPLRG